VRDLRAQLEAVRSSGRGAGGAVLVVVEAVYSMEGDVAPLSRICDLAHEYDACVVVDEAHR
jgi:7-keto-8-aminopelargonate synthetase-like enzyme